MKDQNIQKWRNVLEFHNQTEYGENVFYVIFGDLTFFKGLDKNIPRRCT